MGQLLEVKKYEEISDFNELLDHYYPLSKGYGFCNARKGNTLPQEFFSKEKLKRWRDIYEKFRTC